MHMVRKRLLDASDDSIRHSCRMHQLRSCLLIMMLLVLTAGCSEGAKSVPSVSSTQPSHRPSSIPAIDTVASQTLENMHLHAWNPAAMTHGVTTGGLYINWQMGNPARTNATRPGPDGNSQHNHDPQVDLLYLTALSEYRQLHPEANAYRDDFQRALSLVLADFQQYSQPKGWIYFYLLKNGLWAQNAALLAEARSVANNFYTRWYDPGLRFVYDRVRSPGTYNVDHTITAGAALIDAGLRWHQPAWVSAGENTINHALAVALDPQYHLFYYSMTVSDDGRDRVANYKAKPDIQGQAVDALLTAYALLQRKEYLNAATQVLQSVLTTSGLWDGARGGLFFALDMRTGTTIPDYKETRGQSLVLLACHHYNQLIARRFEQCQQQLVQVLTDHFYQRTYHGFFYRLSASFQIYVTHQGQGVGVEDYFTTEAMGSALDALQQVELVS